MVFKNQSSKVIISKLMRDFDVKEPSLINDMVEWIGDVIRDCHVQLMLEPKDEVVTLADFKAQLPCNFFSNLEVWTYDETLENPDMVKLTTAAKKRKHDNEVNVYSHDYYYVTPNYIKSNLETGKLHLYYDAFPVDDCNLPLIPDLYEFEEAVSYYIMFKLLSRGYSHPVWNLQSAKQMYDDYKHKAENRLRMFTRDDWKTFHAMWAGSWNNYLARYRARNYSFSLLPDTLGDSANSITTT